MSLGNTRYTSGDFVEMRIIEERDNPFFKRKDLKIAVRHPGGATPSKAEVVKELAAKYSVDESQVVIDYIFSQKGLNESFVNCKILNEKPPQKADVKQEPKGENVEAQAGPTA